MPHPEQTSTPASSPDGEVATTNWPMPVFQPAGQARPPAAPWLLDVLRTAAADYAVQGNRLAANEMLDAARAAQELLDAANRAKAWIGMTMVETLGWPAERAANPPEGSHLHAINSAIARATEARA